MGLIESLNWRYATKRMTGEKISQTELDTILEAINLTPTSLGLQTFKVFAIGSEELKKEISEKACQQPQIMESSHILVFAARQDLKDEEIDEYMNNIATTRGIGVEMLNDFKGMIVGAREQVGEHFAQWSARQTYIALGVALTAAAELRIDSTPMEGFSIEALDKVMGLTEKGLSSTLILALGKRNNETDYLVNAQKVRKPLSDLVEMM